MAAVLDSVAVPRSSSFRASLSSSTKASSVLALSSGQGIGSLPEFRGLKVHSRRPSRSSASVSSRNAGISNSGKRIVCEAQETALDGHDFTFLAEVSILSSMIDSLEPCRSLFKSLQIFFIASLLSVEDLYSTFLDELSILSSMIAKPEPYESFFSVDTPVCHPSDVLDNDEYRLKKEKGVASARGSHHFGVLGVPAVTEATWKSLVLDSDLPVLVEFWAPWCGPCRMIHPLIGELSKQYAGKMKCYKLNTDECHPVATQYGIRSIPTIMIFKNGEKQDTVIGAVPKSTLTSSIDKLL